MVNCPVGKKYFRGNGECIRSATGGGHNCRQYTSSIDCETCYGTRFPCTLCLWETPPAVCVICPAGKYSTGGTGRPTCISCPVGQYSDSDESSSCISCPSGKTSTDDRTNCYIRKEDRVTNANLINDYCDVDEFKSVTKVADTTYGANNGHTGLTRSIDDEGIVGQGGVGGWSRWTDPYHHQPPLIQCASEPQCYDGNNRERLPSITWDGTLSTYLECKDDGICINRDKEEIFGINSETTPSNQREENCSNNDADNTWIPGKWLVPKDTTCGVKCGDGTGSIVTDLADVGDHGTVQDINPPVSLMCSPPIDSTINIKGTDPSLARVRGDYQKLSDKKCNGMPVFKKSSAGTAGSRTYDEYYILHTHSSSQGGQWAIAGPVDYSGENIIAQCSRTQTGDQVKQNCEQYTTRGMCENCNGTDCIDGNGASCIWVDARSRTGDDICEHTDFKYATPGTNTGTVTWGSATDVQQENCIKDPTNCTGYWYKWDGGWDTSPMNGDEFSATTGSATELHSGGNGFWSRPTETYRAGYDIHLKRKGDYIDIIKDNPDINPFICGNICRHGWSHDDVLQSNACPAIGQRCSFTTYEGVSARHQELGLQPGMASDILCSCGASKTKHNYVTGAPGGGTVPACVCTAGKYLAGPWHYDTSCTECPRSTYHPSIYGGGSSSDVCLSCPVGKYNLRTGLTTCSFCPIGKTTSGGGAPHPNNAFATDHTGAAAPDPSPDDCRDCFDWEYHNPSPWSTTPSPDHATAGPTCLPRVCECEHGETISPTCSNGGVSGELHDDQGACEAAGHTWTGPTNTCIGPDTQSTHQFCESCDPGYHLEMSGGVVTEMPSERRCMPNVCSCPGGVKVPDGGTGGIDCRVHGNQECSSCNTGYYMSGGVASADATRWVLGAASESCTSACNGLGEYTCSDGVWANGRGQMEDAFAAAGEVGEEHCTSHFSGPSSQSGRTPFVNLSSGICYPSTSTDSLCDASGGNWRRLCKCNHEQHGGVCSACVQQPHCSSTGSCATVQLGDTTLTSSSGAMCGTPRCVNDSRSGVVDGAPSTTTDTGVQDLLNSVREHTFLDANVATSTTLGMYKECSTADSSHYTDGQGLVRKCTVIQEGCLVPNTECSSSTGDGTDINGATKPFREMLSCKDPISTAVEACTAKDPGAGSDCTFTAGNMSSCNPAVCDYTAPEAGYYINSEGTPVRCLAGTDNRANGDRLGRDQQNYNPPATAEDQSLRWNNTATSTEALGCAPIICDVGQVGNGTACVDCLPGQFTNGICSDTQYTTEQECLAASKTWIPSRAGGYLATSNDDCESMICPEDYRVNNSHQCEACPTGSSKTSTNSNNADGNETFCVADACEENNFVRDNQCHPCPGASTRNARDNPCSSNSGCCLNTSLTEEGVASADATRWVLGAASESCTSACNGLGEYTCSDGVWANGRGQMEDAFAAAGEVGEEHCTSHFSGPSSQSGRTPFVNLSSGICYPSTSTDSLCDASGGNWRRLCKCNHEQHGGTDSESCPSYGPDTTLCIDNPCGENEYVSTNVCTDCPAGKTRTAGDNPCVEGSGCECKGPEGQACVAHEVGGTTCTPTLCLRNEYVSGNVCTGCPAGKTNAAGDDASGPDTVCDQQCINSELSCPLGKYIDPDNGDLYCEGTCDANAACAAWVSDGTEAPCLAAGECAYTAAATGVAEACVANDASVCCSLDRAPCSIFESAISVCSSLGGGWSTPNQERYCQTNTCSLDDKYYCCNQLGGGTIQELNIALFISSRITFEGIDITAIPEGSAAREEFLTSFIQSLRTAMADPTLEININAILGGSVIVDFTIITDEGNSGQIQSNFATLNSLTVQHAGGSITSTTIEDISVSGVDTSVSGVDTSVSGVDTSVSGNPSVDATVVQTITSIITYSAHGGYAADEDISDILEGQYRADFEQLVITALDTVINDEGVEVTVNEITGNANGIQVNFSITSGALTLEALNTKFRSLKNNIESLSITFRGILQNVTSISEPLSDITLPVSGHLVRFAYTRGDGSDLKYEQTDGLEDVEVLTAADPEMIIEFVTIKTGTPTPEVYTSTQNNIRFEEIAGSIPSYQKEDGSYWSNLKIDYYARAVCPTTSTTCNQNCLVTWSTCTDKCETKGKRRYSIQVPQSGVGATCPYPKATDCKNREGKCKSSNDGGFIKYAIIAFVVFMILVIGILLLSSSGGMPLPPMFPPPVVPSPVKV